MNGKRAVGKGQAKELAEFLRLTLASHWRKVAARPPRTGSEEAAFQAMERAGEQGRFAEPEEIAQAILYLASDESLYVTGLDLIIDRGFTV